MAISGNKDVKNSGIQFNDDENVKEKQDSLRKTKRVQQLAEEVAGLLIENENIENGNSEINIFPFCTV